MRGAQDDTATFTHENPTVGRNLVPVWCRRGEPSLWPWSWRASRAKLRDGGH
jgi:hypothetical protein